MIDYQYNSNCIIYACFPHKYDKHSLAAYNFIMKRLTPKGLSVYLQIPENEVSAKFKRLMKENWKINFYILSPDNHRCNAAERSIQNFKSHFLTILSGVAPNSSNYMWDHLMDHTELTLNLIIQSTINTNI